MKYIRQFLIILGISLLGEGLHYLLPFPVPASIYGLVILFVLLASGVLKLGQVEETADFFLQIMPVMFIPAAVGIIDSWSDLRPVLLPVALITVLTTVIVMAVTGRITQRFLHRRSAHE